MADARYQNNLMLFLTLVSLVGLSSGVVGSWDAGVTLLNDHLTFVLVLLAPSLITSGAVLWRQWKKR
jgi:hypothetical protein